MLVGARTEDDRLDAVEVDIVDAAEMSGQLVDDLPGRGIPDIHIPVGAAGRHHGAVGRPGAVQQVLLEVVRVSGEHFHTSLPGAERPHVL